jgi:hypothetical protein
VTENIFHIIMTKLFAIFCLILSFTSLFVMPSKALANTDDIRITEINFDGFSNSENDKWVEFGNFGTSTVDLASYSLRTNSKKDIQLSSFLLPPNTIATIGNSLCPSKSCHHIYSNFFQLANLTTISSNNSYVHAELVYNGQVISGIVGGPELFSTPSQHKTLEYNGSAYALSNNPIDVGYATPGSYNFPAQQIQSDLEPKPIVVAQTTTESVPTTPEFTPNQQITTPQTQPIPAHYFNQIAEPSPITTPQLQPSFHINSKPDLTFAQIPTVYFSSLPNTTKQTHFSNQSTNSFAIQSILLATSVLIRAINGSKTKLGKLLFS